MGGSGQEKTYKKMAEIIGQQPIATLDLKTEEVVKDKAEERINEFVKKTAIINLIHKRRRTETFGRLLFYLNNFCYVFYVMRYVVYFNPSFSSIIFNAFLATSVY